jgi:predicted ArsR family transcriptional regulator
MENVVWYLLAGTRGGETRARILWTLKLRPQNKNQLAKSLSLDYKTIQHHLELLTEHRVIELSPGVQLYTYTFG